MSEVVCLTLTGEQLTVTQHTAGPAIVVATAGSGKTTCLLAFIVAQKERGVEPERILCVTFTRAAAYQMLPRLAKRTGYEWARRVRFRTLHSFAYRILRAAGVPMHKVIEDNSNYLRDIMREVGLRNTDQTAVENMGTDISRYINLCRPKDYQPASTSRYFFDKVLEKYQEVKLVERLVDMDDLIERSVEYLEGTPTARQYWQERFDWFLVDEHQDTSPLQWRLIQLVVPEYQPNLIVVGDDDQSVYGWRGATPDALLNFHRVYPGAPVYPLSVNYRCPAPILEPAARLIAHNRVRFPKSIRAAKQEGEPPVIIRPEDPRDEIAQVVEALVQARDNGERLRDYAVLYRTTAQAPALLKRLEEEAIPYRVLGGLKDPFARWMCRDVLAYLRIACYQGAAEDLERVVRRPHREGLGARRGDFPKLLAEHKTVQRVLEYLAATGGYYARTEAKRLRQQFEELRRKTVAEAIPYILNEMDYATGILEYCSFSGSDQNEALEHVFAITMLADPGAPCSAILEAAKAPPRIKGPNASESGVTLSTMHSAKGLEWRVVFIVGAVKRVHPLLTSSGGDPEEERRLFYVGMTRAKERLVISVPRRWSDGSIVEVSPFLYEAGLVKEEPSLRLMPRGIARKAFRA